MSNVSELAKYRTTAPMFTAGNALKGGDDGGTYDGMDPWQQSVETRLGQVNTALWVLISAIGASFVTLVTILLMQTGEIRSDLKGLTSATSAQSERLARVEAKLEAADAEPEKPQGPRKR